MAYENVVDYFDRHPSSNECHVTSDERIFHTKGAADGHANGLKDNKVNSHYRSDFEIIKINQNSPDAQKENLNDTKTNPLELLKNFDPKTAIYPEIKELVKLLGLESPTQKQPDLLATIEAYRVAINTEVKQ
ncbi:hypothetical protein [Flavobacterium fluviatile]|uniref:hypothetical protein n=1 Tax=Flavobacterium fluviatile TaxID=1862387 RepID=UPI0013D47ADD|nr:hypothetical protein [Flavobacterium fluviatile]